MTEVLGLDVVGDSEAQLALQMAITVLGLSGYAPADQPGDPDAPAR